MKHEHENIVPHKVTSCYTPNSSVFITMNAVDETCKLCLKYMQDESLANLDEDLVGKLEFLQMSLVS